MTPQSTEANPRAFINHVDIDDGRNSPETIPGTKGSNWYNRDGKWIGWGGITLRQMHAIAHGMKEGARLIVLHEEESFRRFLRASLPDLQKAARDEDNPGIDYVAEHALFIIERGVIYRIEKVQPIRGADPIGLVSFQFISPDGAQARILGEEARATH